jgi:DNA polymerase-3 subunit alpha
MTAPDFVHLHVHSEYSLLDGANKISKLVQAAADDGQSALALTDHGNLFGAIELYKEAKASEREVKPLIGCEVYIARESMHKPHSKKHGNGYNHLTLIARNQEGYQNLIRLASSAYTEGFSFRPRIDKELLSQFAGGINCLSGCLAGEINQLFKEDKESEAEQLATDFREMFGKEHFWLELQRNGIALQDRVNESMVRLAQRTGIPLVATNDIHYLRHEDCEAQDVLLCINTAAKKAEENRFKFDTDSLFFRTRAEMAHIFRDLPAIVPETMKVAEQVDLGIRFSYEKPDGDPDKYHIPQFRPENGEEPEAFFESLLEAGLKRKYPSDSGDARDRLEMEKRIIRQLGFTSYFLIVWDLILWSRANGIPVGPGRGSAAGSIVSYLLDITLIDPLRHGLIFERFLNPERVSMPDIDIDFCKEGRDRVLEYTRQKYGTDHVAQIITFGTMKARAVIRDVGRVLDIPLREVDRVAKMIPSGPNAPGLSELLGKDSKKSDADLKKLRKSSDQMEELFQYALGLEGMARHFSIHAAGVVIADKPILEYVPLAVDKKAGATITQWAAGHLEDLGLLKMDYLGLRTLTILDQCEKLIKEAGGEVPDLIAGDQDDPLVYELLMAGDTQGIFQLESDGMRKLISRMRPDCFADLVALLALFRPGPLDAGMDDLFVDRKHGREAVTYEHPALEEILQETYGSIVYQEQVMRISSVLGGFSLAEADNLRKAMGKKKPEIMEKFSAQFIAGAVESGCDASVAEDIWANILKFGGYGFNKSHSAAYAILSYQTAWMKTHYRREFLAANLSCEMSDSDKIKALLDDCRIAGIEILGPDLRHSDWGFLPEEEGIRYGLGAIKGTGRQAIQNLVRARDELAKESSPIGLFDLTGRTDPKEVGKIAWEALIKAGAFDFTEVNRGCVFSTLEGALADGAQAALDRRSGQANLFGALEPEEESAPGGEATDEVAWGRQELLDHEHKVLGHYLSGHPLEARGGLLSLLSTTTSRAATKLSGTEISIAGMVRELEERVVQNGRSAGKKWARFRIEDLHGSLAVSCFPRTYAECRDGLAEGDIVVLRGRMEDDVDAPNLLLDELITLEDALRRFEGGLVVPVSPEDSSLLPDLQDILRRHPGRQSVHLQVRGTDGTTRRIRAGNQYRIAISEPFAREVDELLGKGRVSLTRA